MKKVSVEKIIEIFNANIEEKQITAIDINENLSNIGINSLSFIRIIIALEEEYGCEFPDSKLLITELDSIQKIIDVLNEIHSELHNE